jgi:hypothetical protein
MTGHPDPKLVETTPLWRCCGDCTHPREGHTDIHNCWCLIPCGFRVIETTTEDEIDLAPKGENDETRKEVHP